MAASEKSVLTWKSFEPHIARLLAKDDDDALWAVAVDTIYADAMTLVRAAPDSKRICTLLGRCSHWLAPHKARWTPGGGFAWPSGYGRVGFSFTGLPEFDWFCRLDWCRQGSVWTCENSDVLPLKGDCSFRVTIPARSARHRRAAIHTIWQPGPPQQPKAGMTQFYGFRRTPTGWKCTAYRAGREEAYELAAKAIGDDASAPSVEPER